MTIQRAQSRLPLRPVLRALARLAGAPRERQADIDIERRPLDDSTALIVLRARHMGDREPGEALHQFADSLRERCPSALIVVLDDDMSLETVDETKMAAHGWMRIPPEPGPHSFIERQPAGSTCLLMTGPRSVCGKPGADWVHTKRARDDG